MQKLKECAEYSQDSMNYVYRLLSIDRLDVAFQILKTVVKSVPTEYHESVGHAILEMAKQLKDKANASQEIEHIFEVKIFFFANMRKILRL